MFNDYACFSHYMQFLEPIVLLAIFWSFRRLASQPESQSRTGEVVVKVYETLSIYFKTFPSLKLLNFTSDFKSQVHFLTDEIL